MDGLGINPSKGFILGGESAGADIALSIAHLYRDEKVSPPLTGLYTTLTSGISAETVPEKYKDHFFSMEQNSNAPFLTAESVQFVRRRSSLLLICLQQLTPRQTSTSPTSGVPWPLPWLTQTTPVFPRHTSRHAGWIRCGTVPW